jgi:P27 family predicted phage terminase small subunit
MQGNPGNKKLPELAQVMPLKQIAIAPAHLSEIGQNLCERNSRKCVLGCRLRFIAFAIALRKVQRRAELLAHLEASDPVLFTDKGYAYANPLVGMITNLENEIFKMLSSLGLSPSDRSKLGIAEVKKQSVLDQLIARRNQRSS